MNIDVVMCALSSEALFETLFTLIVSGTLIFSASLVIANLPWSEKELAETSNFFNTFK